MANESLCFTGTLTAPDGMIWDTDLSHTVIESILSGSVFGSIAGGGGTIVFDDCKLTCDPVVVDLSTTGPL